MQPHMAPEISELQKVTASHDEKLEHLSDFTLEK